MSAITFDTLKFVETLAAAGVPEPQAKAFARAVADSNETAELATKRDLVEYQSVLKYDLRALESQINVHFEQLESRINIRFEQTESRTNIRFERIEGEMKLTRWMLTLLIAGVASLILKAFF